MVKADDLTQTKADAQDGRRTHVRTIKVDNETQVKLIGPKKKQENMDRK